MPVCFDNQGQLSTGSRQPKGSAVFLGHGVVCLLIAVIITASPTAAPFGGTVSGAVTLGLENRASRQRTVPVHVPIRASGFNFCPFFRFCFV
jgi:hypothetical protein